MPKLLVERNIAIFSFLVLLLAPFFLHALPINNIASDFAKNNTALKSQSKPLLVDMENALYNGDAQFITYSLQSFSEKQEKQPDILILKAIGSIAVNKIFQGRQLLIKAEQNNASEQYVLLAKGMLLRISKDYVEAEKLITKAIEIEHHPYAYNILGRIYFDQHKYTDAISSFNQAIQLNHNFTPAYLNLGAVYLESGNLSAALFSFTKASDLNPLEPRAYLGQAWVFEGIKDYHSAVTSLEKYLKWGGEETLSTLEYLAELQYKDNNYQGLYNTAKQIGKKDTNKGLILQARADIYLNRVSDAVSKLHAVSIESVDKNYLLALCQIIEGNFESAQGYITNAMEHESSSFAVELSNQLLAVLQSPKSSALRNKKQVDGAILPVIAYFKALFYLQENRGNKTYNYFVLAENFVPGFSFAGVADAKMKESIKIVNIKKLALGSFFYYIKMPDRAEIIFLDITAKYPKSLLANYWLGQITLTKGNSEESFTYFKKSIEVTPFFASLYSLAELSLKKADVVNAVKYYEQALELKSDPGILLKLGLLYESSNNYQLVEKTYMKLIDEHPDFFMGYNQLAWFYTKNNMKFDKAMKLAVKANEIQPENLSVLDTIGWLYYKMKNWDKAEKYLTQAYQISSKSPSVLFHLGAVYESKMQRDLAREYINRALTLNSEFDEAAEAREMLNNL
jgi:tetratricopeptide (TPR) repeat protein